MKDTLSKITIALLLIGFISCGKEKKSVKKVETYNESTILKGRVASAHPLATKAGQDVLDSGGNCSNFNCGRTDDVWTGRLWNHYGI
jgi:hypothetical protein